MNETEFLQFLQVLWANGLEGDLKNLEAWADREARAHGYTDHNQAYLNLSR